MEQFVVNAPQLLPIFFFDEAAHVIALRFILFFLPNAKITRSGSARL